MQRLGLTVAATLAAACALLLVSTPIDAKQQTKSFIRQAEKSPGDSLAGMPVWTYGEEYFYDGRTDKIMLRESIEYFDGSSEETLSPARGELMRQIAPADEPAPLTVRPIPCTLVVTSASNQANAIIGQWHLVANIACQQSGALTTCPAVAYEIVIWKQMPNGTWAVDKDLGDKTNIFSCNSVANIVYDAGVTSPGTFRCNWKGWIDGTQTQLWNLTTELTYGG